MNHHVLMADVKASGKADATQVASGLTRIARAVNRKHARLILSPLTVTLGDEFQCIAASALAVQHLVFAVEREKRRAGINLQFRYSQSFGPIDTPINRKIAHGMLGEALTVARRQLARKGTHRRKMYCALGDGDINTIVENLYGVWGTIADRWKAGDYELIEAMIATENDREAGSRFGMNASQVWKRRRTLMIREFSSLEQTIAMIVDRWEKAREQA